MGVDLQPKSVRAIHGEWEHKGKSDLGPTGLVVLEQALA